MMKLTKGVTFLSASFFCIIFAITGSSLRKCSLMKSFPCLLLALTSIFLCSCSGKLQKNLQERMTALCAAGDLVTCEYTVSKVIKADDVVPWKIGERKILFTCKAYLQAGLDMSSYNPAKTIVSPSGKSIVLVLPAPKLLSLNIPVNEIRQEYSHITGLRFDFSAQERNELLRLGEESIRLDVPGMGIIKDARANAISYFTSLLTSLGFEDINIYFEII